MNHVFNKAIRPAINAASQPERLEECSPLAMSCDSYPEFLPSPRTCRAAMTAEDRHQYFIALAESIGMCLGGGVEAGF